jgi:hypothetical protein
VQHSPVGRWHRLAIRHGAGPRQQLRGDTLPFKADHAGQGVCVIRIEGQNLVPDADGFGALPRIFQLLRQFGVNIGIAGSNTGRQPDDGQGFVRSLQRAERPRLLDLQAGIMRFGLLAALRHRQRLPRPAGEPQCFGQLRQGISMTRARPQAGLQRVDRLLQPVRFRKGRAKIGQRFRMTGPRRDRLAPALDGRSKLAAAAQDVAQIVMRFGMTGIDRERAAVGGASASAGLPIRNSTRPRLL